MLKCRDCISKHPLVSSVLERETKSQSAPVIACLTPDPDLLVEGEVGGEEGGGGGGGAFSCRDQCRIKYDDNYLRLSDVQRAAPLAQEGLT